MEALYRRLESEVPAALSSGGPVEPGPAEPDYDSAGNGIRQVAGPPTPDGPDTADLSDPPGPLGSMAGEVPGNLARDRERLDGAVSERGVEALAWYRSFHSGLYRWGIYLREEGIWHVADALAGLGESPADYLVPARDLLVWHEYFHFRVDVAVTTLELSMKAPLYVPRLQQLHAGSPGYGLAEEALANGLAFERIRVSGGRRRLGKFLDRTPSGYRDYRSVVTSDARRTAGGVLLQSYLTRAANDLPAVDPDDVAASVLGRLLDENAAETTLDVVPIWLVAAGPGSALRFISRITSITETTQFRKDLDKAHPKVARQWQRTKAKLAEGTRVGGTNFEKLRGHDDRYSVRLDRSTRVLLRDGRDDGWFAEKVGDHDHVYGR